MRLSIQHTTRYAFDEPVNTGMQQVRLTPASGPTQTVDQWQMTVDGGVPEVRFTDHHGNAVETIALIRGVREVVVRCQGTVTLTETNGVVGRHTGLVPLWLFKRPTPRTKPGPGIRALLRAAEGDSDLDRAHALMPIIAEAVTYELGGSESDWTAEEAVSAGRGVCQDHAHIFIACAREAGWPARYVSGYLMMEDRTTQEAMHAWAEAYLPGLGWVGFDVSNAMCPDDRYVRVASGLDYAEAAPVIGRRTGGSGESLNVTIEVAQQ